MKKVLSVFILSVFLTGMGTGLAEETKKSSSLSGSAQGGMTYSPTEGWIKTGEKQVKTGTDYLVYENKVKAAEENRKKRAELAAKMKAAEEAQKKAAEAASAPAPKEEPAPAEQASEESSPKRKTKKQRKAEEEAEKKAVEQEKQQKLSGKRVLVG